MPIQLEWYNKAAFLGRLAFQIDVAFQTAYMDLWKVTVSEEAPCGDILLVIPDFLDGMSLDIAKVIGGVGEITAGSVAPIPVNYTSAPQPPATGPVLAIGFIKGPVPSKAFSSRGKPALRHRRVTLSMREVHLLENYAIHSQLLGHPPGLRNLMLVMAHDDELPFKVRHFVTQLFLLLDQELDIVQDSLQVSPHPVNLVDLLRGAVEGDDEDIEAGPDNALGHFGRQRLVEIRAHDGRDMGFVGVGHVSINLFVKERLAPAIEGEPDTIVLDFVNGLLEKVEMHDTFLAVDGAQAGMAQGAFELANIGGIYLPFVRVSADPGASQPELQLDAHTVERLS